MSDSVWPHRRQPTMLPCPWDSPGKNTGVGCHLLLQCMKVKSETKSLSHVLLLAMSWTTAYQASPSMGFSRQSTGVGCHCLLWMESLPIINPYTMSSAFTNLSFLFTLNWLDFVTQDFFKISWKLYLFWAHVLFILTGVSLLSNVV